MEIEGGHSNTALPATGDRSLVVEAVLGSRSLDCGIRLRQNKGFQATKRSVKRHDRVRQNGSKFVKRACRCCERCLKICDFGNYACHYRL